MLCFYVYCSQVTKVFRARYKILYDSVCKQGDFIMLLSLLVILSSEGEVTFSVKGNFAKKGYLWSLVCYVVWRSIRTWWQVVSSILENFFWKSLSLQQNFVAATCCKKSNQTEFVQPFMAITFCCRDKDFHKNSPVLTKQFVAAMCHRNMLLQLFVPPVHMEWSVTVTCCCN